MLSRLLVVAAALLFGFGVFGSAHAGGAIERPAAQAAVASGEKLQATPAHGYRYRYRRGFYGHRRFGYRRFRGFYGRPFFFRRGFRRRAFRRGYRRGFRRGFRARRFH